MPKKCETVRVVVVGTGSKGNAYLVTVGDSKLLLDAGIAPAKIRKFNNNKMANIDACLLSHAHTDHSAFIDEIVKIGVRFIYNETEMVNGKFNVYCDYQFHDTLCRGYSIEFKKKGIMFHYITDTYKPIVSPEYMLPDYRHYWIIECNYTEETMEYNNEHESASVVMRNVRTQDTHLSDKTVIEFFSREDILADAILFVHKSELNFDLKLFYSEWKKAFPRLNMEVAENGARYEMYGKKINKVGENV